LNNFTTFDKKVNKVCPEFYHIRQEGEQSMPRILPHLTRRLSEPVATSAPVQDEAIQAVLGMNQKHILPCPRFLVFSASSLPQTFSFLPISPYLPHLILRSLHWQILGELEAKG
jgi:hypothetical protein